MLRERRHGTEGHEKSTNVEVGLEGIVTASGTGNGEFWRENCLVADEAEVDRSVVTWTVIVVDALEI